MTLIYAGAPRKATSRVTTPSSVKLSSQTERITRVNYSGYHLATTTLTLDTRKHKRRYIEDSKKGVFYEYKRSIKKTYSEECKVFWEDIERRYKEEVKASKTLLAEMLANRTTNDDTRKRKRPSDDDDMKPASKP